MMMTVSRVRHLLYVGIDLWGSYVGGFMFSFLCGNVLLIAALLIHNHHMFPVNGSIYLIRSMLHTLI